MAYMRGQYYLWNDEVYLHIWAVDGYDGWDESGWASDENGNRHIGFENASGVMILQALMDEFVMMRLAQMMAAGLTGEAIDRALSHGNNGGRILDRNAAKLKEALAVIELEDPGPL